MVSVGQGEGILDFTYFRLAQCKSLRKDSNRMHRLTALVLFPQDSTLLHFHHPLNRRHHRSGLQSCPGHTIQSSKNLPKHQAVQALLEALEDQQGQQGPGQEQPNMAIQQHWDCRQQELAPEQEVPGLEQEPPELELGLRAEQAEQQREREQEHPIQHRQHPIHQLPELRPIHLHPHRRHIPPILLRRLPILRCLHPSAVLARPVEGCRPLSSLACRWEQRIASSPSWFASRPLL